MAGKTLALVELMRPKNMLLAAITVPLGAHFGMNGAWNADNGLAVAVQIFTVLTSVSYTHLRAHETKANLVCRLLLEKKKK